jgi:biotin carboxylase
MTNRVQSAIGNSVNPQSTIALIRNLQSEISNSSIQMSRILILSTTTGYQLRSFGDAAARLGMELAFATDRCHMIDDPWRDAAIPVRFHEEETSLRAVAEAAHERPIDGVIAVGDRPVMLAARIAEMLALPGNPADAAAASANKVAARRRFAAAGLRTPWFLTLRNGETPEGVPLPCVVKPLGLSGSRGVIRADTPAELSQAVRRLRALLARKDVRVMRTGLEDEILIEGFIEGREYAIEGVLTNGALHVFTIFDKPDPLEGPFFEETIYLTPSSLPASSQHAIVEQIGKAARALGLRHGPVHAECRLGEGGIFVLEIAARPIGGLCSKVLRFENGEPLEEILLRHAAGEDVTNARLDPRAAGVMMIPIPKRGRLRQVAGADDARLVDGVEEVRITAKPDQLLEPLPEAGSYLGFIFARDVSSSAVDAALRHAHARLQFTIEPALELR